MKALININAPKRTPIAKTIQNAIVLLIIAFVGGIMTYGAI